MLQGFFSEVKYKNLVIEPSPDGDTKFYGLTLLTKEIATPSIPGLGIKIVFFPDTSKYSAQDITIDWSWPIKRHINTFNQQGFSYAPEAFIDILLQIADIEDEQEFIESIVTMFLNEPDAYKTFFTELKAKLNNIKQTGTPELETEIDSLLNIMQNDIEQKIDAVFTNTPDTHLIEIATDYENLLGIDETQVSTIQNHIEEIQALAEEEFDPYKIIIELLLKDTQDLDQKFDQLLALFQTWLGNIDKEDVEYLLIPHFKVALQNIDVAMEFPRNWLVPIYEDTHEEIPGDPHSKLTYNVGSLEYSTDDGFTFLKENNFDFTFSRIGNTGLTIGFKELKVDLSRTTNIPEADMDGRPVEFMGVYARKAVIGLPKEWFELDDVDSANTLGIIGRNLLIGTGGISGIVGLEALGGENEIVDADSPGSELIYTLGKNKGTSETRKGFKVGFKEFHLKWQQNTLIESSIKGSFTLPKVRQYDLKAVESKTVAPFDDNAYIDDELKINIEMGLQNDGDFQITAKPRTLNAEGEEIPTCFAIKNAFYVKVDGLRVAREESEIFVETSGELGFKNNKILSEFFKGSFGVKKLRIYSDGNIEIEGGSIPVPFAKPIPLGPVDITVSNITFGADEREHNGQFRKYKFFGFSAQVSVGAAGVEGRADGVKFCFTVDDDDSKPHHSFLKIEGIGVDITIPGNASPETAAVIIKGYLSMRKEEYLGDISITLPKLKMKGGAAMRMQPKKPAWIVDAMLEMSTPIPLAATGLGIFGFRGLFGYRYVASKSAAGLETETDASWTDYYLSKNPAKGVHIQKMAGPPETDGSKNPVAIGAGLSIATASDEGRAFSIQAFFLLSLPDVILIQGKANVMGERVGLTDGDPPFFALAAFSPGHSIEFAFGADYKERDKTNDGKALPPAKKGRLVSLYAEVRSAYYFEDRDAWFVHFGTKQKPVKAQIAKLFDAYAYLMLSARGIETGAGIRFGFEKKYGPVRATALVYIDLYGNLSFQGAQVGAGLALGGQVDVTVWGVGFGISVATTLEATLPRPYRIHGSVEVCVYVKVLIKKFEKCIDVEFVWLKDTTKEGQPIAAITTDDLSDLTTMPTTKMPVSAMHIGSKRSYPIQYFGSTIPDPNKIKAVIPLDSFVDIQFEKALDGTPVLDIIGGVTNGAHRSIERVPPKPSYNDTKHSYKIERIQIQVHSQGQWVDYHPYEALAGDTFDPSMLTGNSPVDISELKIGYFQKDGKEYNKIRLLAQTPFSYLDNSTGKFVPERMGITGGTLFCREKAPQRECLVWDNSEEQYPVDKLVKRNKVLINVRNNDGSVRAFKNAFNIDNSLYLPQGSSVELMLPEPALSCHVKLFSFAREVMIEFFSLDRNSSPSSFKLEKSFTKTPAELSVPIEYESSLQPTQRRPVEKIVITDTSLTNPARISEIDHELAEIEAELYVIKADKESIDEEKLISLNRKKRALTGERNKLENESCARISSEKPYDEPVNNAKAEYESQLKEIKQQIDSYQETIERDCDDSQKSCDPTKELMIPKDCLKQMQLLTQRYSGENPRLYHKFNEIIKLSERLENQLESINKPYVELKGRVNRYCEDIKERLANLEQEIKIVEKKLEEVGSFSGYVSNKESHDCGTYLHELCWLSESVVEYQQTIPSQEAIEADYNLLKEAVEKTLQLLWRPKQTYRVELTVSDSVDSGIAQKSTIYFGFKTEGPIGHFASYVKIQETLDSLNSDSQQPLIEAFDKKDEQAETSLQFYVDDKRSYPYGSILWQKPLYYENPKLKLFFTKPYVQHFFSEWPQYQGLDKLTGRLDVLIKDPAEGVSRSNSSSPPSHDDSVLGQLPIAQASFKTDSDPIRGQDTAVYDQLRNPERMNPEYQGVGFGSAGGDPEYPAAGCWKSGGDPIIPLSKSLEIEVKHLKPLKLYTAIVRNHYSGAKPGEEDKEVLRYNFQTSRFRNFKEHIDSYLLKDKKSNTLKAIFDVEIDPSHTGLSDSLFLKRTQEMVINNPNNMHSYVEGLATTYSDPFQRLMEGHFAIQPLHPTSGIEFNFLRLKGKKTDFAILIRSIEPIIDPRITGGDLNLAIAVGENDALTVDYYPLWSQDRSQVLLMNSRNLIPGRQINSGSPAVDLKIIFANLEWNGRKYDISENAVTDNLREGV